MIRHEEPFKYLKQDHKPLDLKVLGVSSTARLVVRGIGCVNCEARVHNALLALDGVSLVRVFRWERIALVAYDTTRVTPDQLVAAVRGAADGPQRCYEAEVTEVRPAKETLKVVGGVVQWQWPDPAPQEPEGVWG